MKKYQKIYSDKSNMDREILLVQTSDDQIVKLRYDIKSDTA